MENNFSFMRRINRASSVVQVCVGMLVRETKFEL